MPKRNWKGALQVVEDVLRQDPTNVGAQRLREQLVLLGKRERRLRHDPSNAQAQLEVGFSYFALACYPEAIEALSEAARLNPDLFM